MNLYSRIDPTQLLHIINRKRDIQQGRVDLVEPDNFIQCAAIRQPNGVTYKPHRHIVSTVNHPQYITQESWIIISGLVKVMLYDLDNSLLHEDVLEPGDVSITLAGGHNYLFLHESVVYEYKTGPYLGVQKDKEFI